MSRIKKGTIIIGSNWDEPVEIELIEDIGDYLRIVGVTTKSRVHINDLVSLFDFQNFQIQSVQIDFTEPAWKVFLAYESIRFKYASLYDPLLAMNTSKVHPLPHQIEAVYGYILKLPRIRFLIADDPGAGKTIMAGLIIKELKLRQMVKRILIVVPGHMKDQWCRELKDRFEEHFTVIDRGQMDTNFGLNVWQKESQIVTSIDFAKREDIINSLSANTFDLIIVDEAHKMSAYKYGDTTSKTNRYKLGEVLSRNTEHLLFLTATPHRGDPENFRLFLDLLEPGFFSSDKMLEESIASQDNPLFIRRVKEDLKDFDGKPLFLPRHVDTISYNLGRDSPQEKDLYNKLSTYVNSQYNKALAKDKKRNVTFALVILQRRFASSIYALYKSLERRKDRLEKILKDAQERNNPIKAQSISFDFDIIDDYDEADRWKEEEIWETLSVAENLEELKIEIETIKKLIEQAYSIIESESEIKLNQLKNTLTELYNNCEDKTQCKILIFTESRDTLEYLEKKIKSWGYSTNCIHGGMRLAERIEAEKVFKTDTEIMVATEAAGEGINLQFCNLMINYDIPWNPNRLEQRMGRIHRYGQTKEVFIYNLVAIDTREGQVLNKLFEKLEEIRRALNSDKVFDVISEVLENKSLSELMLEAAASARNIDEILSELDIHVDEDYIARIKENLNESLATHYIDYTRIKEIELKAREYKLIPEYTENFFKKGFLKIGGVIRERKDGFLAVDNIPSELRVIAKEESFVKSFGKMLPKYQKITFDNDVAFKNPDTEFVSFGHPLFEALMIYIQKNYIESLVKGATFIDPDGMYNGYLLFYEGEIKDGTNRTAGKRLFIFYISQTNEVKEVNPTILWDLEEQIEDSDQSHLEPIDLDKLKNLVYSKCIPLLESYRQEILKDREHQAAIKEKYGIKSLDQLIYRLQSELIPLYERKENNEMVDLPIHNKEERLQEYINALSSLKSNILKEKSLTMVTPRFIGIAQVRPGSRLSSVSRPDDAEIEQIGMRVAMDFEKNNERIPQDISMENLGFDIRSKSADGTVRYIEVKARASVGPVSLTQNEWFKAKRFKTDYYLYIVFNTRTEPKLYIVQNPAETLNPKTKIEARYIVNVDEIYNKDGKHE